MQSGKCLSCQGCFEWLRFRELQAAPRSPNMAGARTECCTLRSSNDTIDLEQRRLFPYSSECDLQRVKSSHRRSPRTQHEYCTAVMFTLLNRSYISIPTFTTSPWSARD